MKKSLLASIVTMVLLATAPLILAGKAEAGFEFTGGWKASFPGSVTGGEPNALAVSPEGTVFVAAYERGTVRKFSSTGEPLGRFEARSNWIEDLAVAADGNLLIASDLGIEVRSQSGELLDVWKDRKGRELGYCACSITVAGDGTVYTADYELDWIEKYSPDGTMLDIFGGTGDKPHQVRSASGIAAAPDGSVLVLDADHHRVKRLSADGKFIDQWGSRGWAPGKFLYPGAIAVNQAGQVFVADGRLNRIQKFSANGRFLEQWGSRGRTPERFMGISDIALDADSLFTAEPYNDRIQRMQVDDAKPRRTGALFSRAAGRAIRAEPGEVVNAKFKVVNFGSAKVKNVRYCPPQRGLIRFRFVGGFECRSIGAITPQSSKTFKVRVRAPRKSKRRRALVPLWIGSSDAGGGPAWTWIKLRN